MEISKSGVDLIASFEGCRLQAYQDIVGVWTIGYGHTAGVKKGDKLPNVEAAKKLLQTDVKKYGDAVNSAITNKTITFSVNQNMFDALTSFAYNLGVRNVPKLCNGRTANQVADAMLKYNKAGGKEVKGLTKRRQTERKLFLTNPFDVPLSAEEYQNGSKGSKVKWIQQQLVFKNNANIRVDGSFGPLTVEAVKAFQKKVRLPETGIVEAKTLAKLK